MAAGRAKGAAQIARRPWRATVALLKRRIPSASVGSAPMTNFAGAAAIDTERGFSGAAKKAAISPGAERPEVCCTARAIDFGNNAFEFDAGIGKAASCRARLCEARDKRICSAPERSSGAFAVLSVNSLQHGGAVSSSIAASRFEACAQLNLALNRPRECDFRRPTACVGSILTSLPEPAPIAQTPIQPERDRALSGAACKLTTQRTFKAQLMRDRDARHQRKYSRADAACWRDRSEVGFLCARHAKTRTTSASSRLFDVLAVR